MTSPNPLHSVTPTQVITRLQMLSQGARIVMTMLLGTGGALLILLATTPDRPAPILMVGLSAIQGGFTMLVGALALQGHKAMVEQEQRTQLLIRDHERKVDERVARLEAVERRLDAHLTRILQLAACDDLAERRQANGG